MPISPFRHRLADLHALIDEAFAEIDPDALPPVPQVLATLVRNADTGLQDGSDPQGSLPSCNQPAGGAA